MKNDWMKSKIQGCFFWRQRNSRGPVLGVHGEEEKICLPDLSIWSAVSALFFDEKNSSNFEVPAQQKNDDVQLLCRGWSDPW